MAKRNCDNVNPDLRLTAGKHGNRMSAHLPHLSQMPLVCIYTQADAAGVLRSQAVIAWKVSDADLRGN